MPVICDDMTMLPQDVHDLPEHASAGWDVVFTESQIELTQWYCVIWATDIAACSSASRLAHMTLFSCPCRWYCSCNEAMEAKRVLMWDSRQLKDKLVRVGTGVEVTCLGDMSMALEV